MNRVDFMDCFSSVATNREELHLHLDLSQPGSPLFIWKGIGDLQFLRDLKRIRETSQSWTSLEDTVAELRHWQGNSAFELMLREVVEKAKGVWTPPFVESELCHCRMVPTEIVHSAIIGGAHSPTQVSALTNASTQCGTCRPDVQGLLKYRLR